MGDVTLVLLAKEPRPGLVKTRLTPPCTPAGASALASASLRDTFDVIRNTPAKRRVLALQGDAGSWVPPELEVVPQPSGSLDVRIAAALDVADGPVVLVGMDTPQLTPALLTCDFDAHPAWLGPAEDGGFWLIGLAEPDPALVLGTPMSTTETYARQRQRLLTAGLSPGVLPVLRDVDTWEDARAVAATAPDTEFARQLARTRVSVVTR